MIAVAASPGAVRAQTSGASAFAIEAAGATVGSAATTLAVLALSDRCSVEDLGCLIKRIAVAGVASIPGAAGGAYVAGRAADTRPSGIGVTLGAILGVGAGVGMLKVFEEMNVRPGRAGAVIIYSLSQGLTTALVDRLPAFR